MKNKNFAIKHKDRKDYVRLTGLGNSWVYDNPLGMTLFTKTEARKFHAKMEEKENHVIVEL